MPPVLKFGLNIAPKKTATPRTLAAESDSDEEIDTNVARANKSIQQSQLSTASQRKHKQQIEEALKEDPNVFDYDGVWDGIKAGERAKVEARRGETSKKPKYIGHLLEMAETRKRDRLLAEEKKVQREREAEGEEFANSERFVTDAYRQQMEELKRAEEEEAKREAANAAKAGSNMSRFYRSLLDSTETDHAATVANAKSTTADSQEATPEPTELSDTQLAMAAQREGKDVILNDDGQIVDKRQLLSAGLNVSAKAKQITQAQQSTARQPTKQQGHERRRPGRFYMSEQLEAQLLEKQREAKEAEREAARKLEEANKKRTTEEGALSARERYLARKKAKMEEKKDDE